MKIHEYRCEQWLPQPPEVVFPFFADARNLEALTPPWLSFTVVTPGAIAMHAGAIIDYQLRVHGVPLKWKTEITVWEPPYRFVDVARRSPYRKWHHEHRFIAQDGGTLCTDVVEYAVPFDFISHRWIVRPDVERIFAFRRQALTAQFPAG